MGKFYSIFYLIASCVMMIMSLILVYHDKCDMATWCLVLAFMLKYSFDKEDESGK